MAGPWDNYAPDAAVPPAGLKPGSRAYADWAVEQVKAGRTVPQLMASESLPEWAAPSPWKTPGEGEPGIPIISEITRPLYPFERNVETGEYRLAVPKIIPAMIEGAIDAFTLPGDTMQGKYDQELDPRYGVANVSPELAGRILNFSGFVGSGEMPGPGPDKLARLRQETATKEADSYGVPLTYGQASGDLNQLRSEQLLRQADPSQPLMRTFDDRQTEAIGAATATIGKEFGGMAGDLAGTVTIGLQNKTKEVKEGADAFFEVAQDGKLKVRPAAVKALPSFVRQRLAGVAMDGNLTRAAVVALKEIDDASLAAGRRSLSWKALDEVRRKLAGLTGTSAEDVTATRTVKEAFDDWLGDAVDQQLFSGDEAALQALKAARAESSQYLDITNPKRGDVAGATIARMQQGDATAEQVANWLYGADVVSPNLAATDVAKRLKGVLGPLSEEWKTIRAAAWNKLVNDPATGAVRPPATLAKRLDTFLSSDESSLAGTLFSEEERSRMKALAVVLKRVDLPVDARHPSRSPLRSAIPPSRCWQP